MHPKTKYGQNFLVDLNLLKILIDGAALAPNDVVLEIGTGLGSLTKSMATKVGAVVTVEVDRDLHALAAKELKSFSNVQLLSCDALRNKNHLRDEVLDAVRATMTRIPNARFKLVANLPYNVATPIISNLLTVEPLAERMVVTIQKELGELEEGADLDEMEHMSRDVGRMSGRYEFAEGWRRHSHLGFGPEDFDPVSDLLQHSSFTLHP